MSPPRLFPAFRTSTAVFSRTGLLLGLLCYGGILGTSTPLAAMQIGYGQPLPSSATALETVVPATGQASPGTASPPAWDASASPWDTDDSTPSATPISPAPQPSTLSPATTVPPATTLHGGAITHAFERSPEAENAIRMTTQGQVTEKDTETWKDTVLDVRAEGNIQIPMTTINSIIKTRKNRPFAMSSVEEDKRALIAKGWFVDVKPRVERTPEGYIITYFFIERPLLHYVKVVGNKGITKKRLEEEAAIQKGDALDPIAVYQAKEKMETLYKLEGYHGVHIEVLRGDRIGDRGAIFLVNEGVKQRILKTRFVGNTITSGSRLKTQIDSKPGIFWYLMHGQFTRQLVEQDVEKLTAYYRKLGYFYAKIDYDIEESSGYTGRGEPNSWVTLTFLIDEGPRCKIRDIRFIGNTMFTNEELKKEMKSRIGKFYYQDMVEVDMAKIRDKHGVLGHVFSEAVPDPRIDGDEVDLIVQVREGPKCRVGDIKMRIIGVEGGEPYTALAVALNPISLKPGDILSTRELDNSKRRLIYSGIFNGNPAMGETPDFTFEMPQQYLVDEERRKKTEEEEERKIASPNAPNYRGQVPMPRRVYRYRQPTEIPPVEPTAEEEQALRAFGKLFSPLFETPRTQETPSVNMSENPSVNSVPLSDTGNLPNNTSENGLHTVRKQPLVLGQTSYATTATPFSPYDTADNTAAQAAYGSQTSAYGSVPAYAGTGITPNTATGTTTGTSAAAAPAIAQSTGTPTALDLPAYPESYQRMNATAPANISPSQTQGQSTVQAVPYNVANANPTTTAQYGTVRQSYGRGNTPADLGLYPMGTDPAGPPKPVDPIYDVSVTGTVREQRTGQLMMSVAVNSDSGLMGRFVLQEDNFDICRFPRNPFRAADWHNAFRGKGQVFRIEAVPGENVQRYEARWGTPYLFNRDYSFYTSGYYYQRFYDEWYEDRVGGTLTFGKSWTKDFATSLKYNGGRVTIYDEREMTQADYEHVHGKNAFHTFELSATHSTVDSQHLPTEGHVLSAAVSQTVGKHQYLGGRLDLRKYFMLRERPDRSGRWVLSLRTAASVTEGQTPIYDRYFAGGFSSLRGFEYRTISPRDPQTLFPTGGTFEFYNSAELIFPLTADDMIRGLVFIDSGTVQKTIKDWEEDYRVAVGFGFRITIPMMGPAPIALDFAFPLTKSWMDETQLFTFNVGFFR